MMLGQIMTAIVVHFLLKIDLPLFWIALGPTLAAWRGRAKDSTTSIAFQLAWWNRRSGRPMVDNMTAERPVATFLNA